LKLLLPALAAQRLAALRASRPQERQTLPPLAEWVTRIPVLAAKSYVQPLHLKPLLDALEAIQRGESVRLVCHTPPRGGKTETLLAAVSWWLAAHPSWEVAYCSYNATQARSKAIKARDWAKAMGINVVRDTVVEWRTPEGGGCIARGVGEGITGQGVDIAIVDDPVKDRQEAESALKRQRALDWFNEALFTRRNPGARPQSIIVNMARWHPDDLAGTLVKQGWRYVCLPAIDDAGRSFWPELWPVPKLEEVRAQLGPYSFESLYQGRPRPRGGAVFGDPWVYETAPTSYRVGMGLDLAYSKKTSSDWSVLVVMALHEGHFYVLDVVRSQARAPEFAEVVKRYRTRYPGARMRWYGAGTEMGVADFLRPSLPFLEFLPATADKFMRAQKYAAAWNAGKVLLPEQSEAHPVTWLDRFVDEHVNFTGVADAHDDIVDAAVAAFDVLSTVRENRPAEDESVAPRRM
jgi:predicted phage terminase large subunit-like protein